MTAILSVVGGILAIAGTVGAALGVLTASRSKTVIELQRQTIEELERQSKSREAELVEVRTRLSAAEDKINILTETVTSAAKVEALATLTLKQHEEIMDGIRLILRKLSDM